MHRRFISVLRFVLLIVVLMGKTSQPQSSADALTTLTVQPLTWNLVLPRMSLQT